MFLRCANISLANLIAGPHEGGKNVFSLPRNNDFFAGAKVHLYCPNSVFPLSLTPPERPLLLQTGAASILTPFFGFVEFAKCKY